MNENNEIYDIAVIGGGPAGMIAAARAAELGARVILIEKNREFGRKLIITGKGRCNITQVRHAVPDFIKQIGKKGKFLYSALSIFGPEDVVNFFESKKLEIKMERGGRVFPVSDNSKDVTSVLIQHLKDQKVKLMTGTEVTRLFEREGRIGRVEIGSTKIIAENYILATGGRSYPVTGSTGDGYSWARSFGHKIVHLRPALVPMEVKEKWAISLQGLSLKNVELHVIKKGKREESRFGEMIFTHFGISGPIVLDISRTAGELLKRGEVDIEIDLKPALDITQLDKRLQRDFETNSNKDFKNYLPELLPQKLIEVFLSLSTIESNRKLHSITKEDRKGLVQLLKGIKLTVTGLMSYEQAIITTGGVDLKEVDSKTMRSKIIPNLFFAGEILDLDGPTGGYNLQICWSTGYAAGTHAVIHKDSPLKVID